jgi:capsular polysaccharide biosynthesis protein
VNLNKKGVPMTAQPNYHDDEINLRDYINVLIKRKITILVVFLVCITAAAIYSFTAPEVYNVFQIIKVPTIGMKKYLDSPTKIKERISEGIYNQKIKNALGLGKKGEFDFKFSVPDENIFIKVGLKAAEDKIEQSIAILEELINQLETDYAPNIFTELNKLANDIFLKENQIERKKGKIKTLTETIKLTEERIASLEKELARVNANVEELRLKRADFIQPSAGKDSMAVVLYTTTIQQAIRYSNQLEDQLNSLKTNKKEKENSIEDLEKTIEDIKIQIGSLENSKKFISNVKQLQPPIYSESPISPNKKQNITIAAVLGLFLGVFIAFFREFWANSAVKEKE